MQGGDLPACGQTTVFEEDDLAGWRTKCPGCGKPLDFEVTEGVKHNKGPSPQRGGGPFSCLIQAGLVCLLQPDAANVSALYRPFLVVWRNTHPGPSKRPGCVVGGKT